jgi:hypothetical protein
VHRVEGGLKLFVASRDDGEANLPVERARAPTGEHMLGRIAREINLDA